MSRFGGLWPPDSGSSVGYPQYGHRCESSPPEVVFRRLTQIPTDTCVLSRTFGLGRVNTPVVAIRTFGWEVDPL